MEQTTEIEVFDNDIDLYLKQFITEQKIKDMKKEPQNVWNAAMMYIKRHVFNDSRVLKRDRPLEGYKNNNYNDNEHSKLNYSNCNAYDIDKVNIVADYYIYICSLYDKEISLIGFSNLTGITTETLKEWGRDERKLSTASFSVHEKISKYREESLSAKLLTAGKNSVGILGILNHQFGWNMPGVSRETASRNTQRTPEQIAQEYGQTSPAQLPEPPKD